MLSRRNAALATCLVTALGVPTLAHAGEVSVYVEGTAYSFIAPADTGNDSATGTQSVGRSLTTLSGTPFPPDVHARHFSSAGANLGSIGAIASSRTEGTYATQPGQVPLASGQARASFTIDDIQFTGGSPGTLVEVTPLFEVSGDLSRFALPGSDGTVMSASSLIDLDIEFGPAPGGTNFSGRMTSIFQQRGFDPPDFEFNAIGDLSGVTFPATIALDPFTAVVGLDYTLTVSLRVQSLAQLGGIPTGTHNGTISSSALFGSTVSFPTTGPVFLLPDGFSATSLSASIESNEWTGTLVSVAPVPLPGALGLLACALGAVCFGARAGRPDRVRHRKRWIIAL
ncbi:MAG: hypothetical protein KDK91_03850 [Gammaproteobacteria bacterium]|nr:hypothetical protein [Gammaproteobacteria bacterium]